MSPGTPPHAVGRHGNGHGWLHYFRTIKWRTRLIVALLMFLVLVPLVTHHFLDSIIQESRPDVSDGGPSRSLNQIDSGGPVTCADLCVRYHDLRFRVDELRRIKISVNNELRDLEARRQRLHTDITGYNNHIDKLRKEYERAQYDYNRLQNQIENKRMEAEEMSLKNQPVLRAPLRLVPEKGMTPLRRPSDHRTCRMSTCFDYSRCSISSMFPVYFYPPDEVHIASTDIEPFVKISVTHALNASPHLTYDPNIACLYVVLLGEPEQQQLRSNNTVLEARLSQLSHWNGDGRNHLLINMARMYTNRNLLMDVNTGRAMIAQSPFTLEQYRRNFDVVLPPSLGISHGDIWDQMPPISPARRKYLLSFQGELYMNALMKAVRPADKGREERWQRPLLASERHRSRHSHFTRQRAYWTAKLTQERDVTHTLTGIQRDYPSDNFRLEFSCVTERTHGLPGEYDLCGPDSKRKDLLALSTFALILGPLNGSDVTTTLIQVRVAEAIKYGAIPVILGDDVILPFSEVLQWRRAAIILPKDRVTELHLILRALSDGDILEYRHQGRHLVEKYMGTTKAIVDTLLAAVRTRLNIPAFPVTDESSPSVFNSTFQPLKQDVVDMQIEGDDTLGPVEPPVPSVRFMRNYTFSAQDFNAPGDVFHLYPYTPFSPVMPAEAKFMGSEYGFRPINKGLGGAGREFSGVLGGNVPREQFTIVILTYERQEVLVHSISRLKGLPNLNKVVVVWNSPSPPSEDLRWPEIGVEIAVIRTARNSLNNRFLPYDVIETEAILSTDDDAHLRHDEILFGFRVWRENRDRLVGFPGRFHGYDVKAKTWFYNSNYSCELSMVLTGAAFLHKYYAYMYSYIMPQAIRDKVDQFVNCEDLAMNFLVSHITRKPPIKVTSRWTFRCPGCPKALSVEDSHFQERHKCINYFTKIYGYMPLLYTQFRADSILFKTRIPHNKQKCFKFI